MRRSFVVFCSCVALFLAFCVTLCATVDALVYHVIEPESWLLIDEPECEEYRKWSPAAKYLPQKSNVFWYTRHRLGPQYTKAKLEIEISASPQPVSFYIVDTELSEQQEQLDQSEQSEQSETEISQGQGDLIIPTNLRDNIWWSETRGRLVVEKWEESDESDIRADPFNEYNAESIIIAHTNVYHLKEKLDFEATRRRGYSFIFFNENKYLNTTLLLSYTFRCGSLVITE